ncbi:hypothetical protein Anas_04385 [Armadillidium nasatum]|uniref:Uncharacterized protein n=1 Tax=Armadillidium nasatum TaxID=96803 RepID=A0A5N5TNN4_9CRUS|nr:hypothetical protein Anas_04385 [Armadillidium nasatum]
MEPWWNNLHFLRLQCAPSPVTRDIWNVIFLFIFCSGMFYNPFGSFQIIAKGDSYKLQSFTIPTSVDIPLPAVGLSSDVSTEFVFQSRGFAMEEKIACTERMSIAQKLVTIFAWSFSHNGSQFTLYLSIIFQYCCMISKIN